MYFSSFVIGLHEVLTEIQGVSTILTFKKQLKLHIFDQYRGDPNGGTNSDINRHNVNNRRNNNTNRVNNNQRWRNNVNQPFFSRWNNQLGIISGVIIHI